MKYKMKKENSFINTEEVAMKRYLILSFLIVFASLFLAGCKSDDDFNDNHDLSDEDVVETVDGDQTDAIPDDNDGGGETATAPPPNNYRWTHIISTGQTACYNNIGEIDCPSVGEPFFGQDGNYRVGVRSYDTSAGNGTVFDNVTGLRWQRGVATDLTWFQAKTYCQELHVGDTNWRLPTTVELKTLVDYDTSSPAIDSTAFPKTPSEWFWATETRHSPGAAWVIYFLDGFVEYTAQTNTYAVRCVEQQEDIMKKLTTLAFIVALMMLFTTTTLSAQCSNCAGTLASQGNFDPDFAPDWTIADSANNTIVGRGTLQFNVTVGIVYRWTTVGSEDLDGAAPGLDFDTEITLRKNCTYAPDGDGIDVNMLLYNDNGLYRNQSLVEWKATYTGTVIVLVTEKRCSESITTTSVRWQRIGSSECANNYRPNPPADPTEDPLITPETFSSPADTPNWTTIAPVEIFPATDPVTMTPAILGGDYQWYTLEKGAMYRWTNAQNDGFDSQLTLFKKNTDGSLTFIAYNDDDESSGTTLSTLEYIVETTDPTMTVQLLTSQYRCSTCQADAFGSYAHCSTSTLQWQRGDCTKCLVDKNSGSAITPDTSEDDMDHLKSGDYTYFNVVAGKTYRWRLEDSSYMVTVRQGGTNCSGAFLTHGDSVTWRASFTGVAEVLISKIGACTSVASGDMKLFYKIVDDPENRFIEDPLDGQVDIHGNPETHQFMDIVLDTQTKTFYKELSAPAKTWQNAITACEALVVTSNDSHDPPVLDNWRLITINELSSIVDYDKISPASFYPGISSAPPYWSSTTIHNSADFAWSIIMDDGRTYRAPKTELFSVLCAAGATISGEVQKDFPMQTRHVVGWACDRSDPNDQLDVRLTFYDKNGAQIKYKPHVMWRDIEKDIDAKLVESDLTDLGVDPSEIPSQAYIDSQCGGDSGEPHMFYFDLTGGFDADELPNFTADKAPFFVKVEAEIRSGWSTSYFEVVNSPQQFLLVDVCGDGFQSGDPSQGTSIENCDDGNADTEECDYGLNFCTVCDGTCRETWGATHICGDGDCDGGFTGTGDLQCDSTGLSTGPEDCDDGGTEDETCTNYEGMCGSGTGTCNICDKTCVLITLPAPCCGDGVWNKPADFPTSTEECDDGPTKNNNDNCLDNCTLYRCGDGYINATASAETCDNGDALNGTYNNDCNTTCDGKAPFCGDANIDVAASTPGLTVSELCDNGTANGTYNAAQGTLPTSCGVDCMSIAPYCGDAIKDEGDEDCDLGPALNNGDYAKCNPDCSFSPHCGDGITDLSATTPGLADNEDCDSGVNNGLYGFCKTDCTGTVKCGDGEVYYNAPGNEECDWLIFGYALEWKLEEEEACTSGCQWASYCGDGTWDGTLKNFPTMGVDFPSPDPGAVLTIGKEMCDDGAANIDADLIDTNTSYESDCVAIEALAVGDENNRGCKFTHYCGDGVTDNTATNGVDGDEGCDAGSDNGPNSWCTPECQINICGDGFRCSDASCDGTTAHGSAILEKCDDKNASNTDSCINTAAESCVPAEYHDGYRKLTDSAIPWPGWVWNGDTSQLPNEACDDGNTDNTDGCVNEASLAKCNDTYTKDGDSVAPFDGWVWNGGAGTQILNEECDRGASNHDNNACLSTCKKNTCHDGIRCSGSDCAHTAWSIIEACDDQNTDNTDGCVDECALARCGDNHQKDGDSDVALWNGDDAQIVDEVCEDGNDVLDNCTDPLNPTEQVCSETCEWANCNNTCGDEKVDPGEQCDNYTANADNASCTTSCQDAFCGDTYTWNTDGGNEDCDDGNSNNNDGCIIDSPSYMCKTAECGDAYIYTVANGGTEECDLGTAVNNDHGICTVGCKTAICGDNLVYDTGSGDEECDGTNIPDTCTSLHGSRTYYTGSSVTCSGTCDNIDNCNYCGDGDIQSGNGEDCDDENTTANDGCENDCTFTCVNPAADCSADVPGDCRTPACVTSANGQICGFVTNTADIPPATSCRAAGSCSGSTATAGALFANGTSCGGCNYCNNGTCGEVCGDGIKGQCQDCDRDAAYGNKWCATDCSKTIIYVKASGGSTNINAGYRWGWPYRDLQTGLDRAKQLLEDGKTAAVDIRMAAGTYKPSFAAGKYSVRLHNTYNAYEWGWRYYRKLNVVVDGVTKHSNLTTNNAVNPSVWHNFEVPLGKGSTVNIYSTGDGDWPSWFEVREGYNGAGAVYFSTLPGFSTLANPTTASGVTAYAAGVADFESFHKHFQLMNYVKIEGGYRALNDGDITQSKTGYPTYISGDINSNGTGPGDAYNVFRHNGIWCDFTNGGTKTTARVLSGYLDNRARLEDLYITGGYGYPRRTNVFSAAEGYYYDYGYPVAWPYDWSIYYPYVAGGAASQWIYATGGCYAHYRPPAAGSNPILTNMTYSSCLRFYSGDIVPDNMERH